jgi:hypothetical protein
VLDFIYLRDNTGYEDYVNGRKAEEEACPRPPSRGVKRAHGTGTKKNSRFPELVLEITPKNGACITGTICSL